MWSRCSPAVRISVESRQSAQPASIQHLNPRRKPDDTYMPATQAPMPPKIVRRKRSPARTFPSIITDYF